MLGHRVADLEVGETLGPLDHLLTPFLVREYAHAVEDPSARFHGDDEGAQVAPPTIVHTDKVRMLDTLCPDRSGPARLHLVYDATHHRPVPASRLLSVTGEVTDRYERRGRDHLVITFEVRDKVTGALYTTYRDTSLMGFRQG
jgi:hypothetical protein